MYFNYLEGDPQKNEAAGKLERLEKRVQQLLQESADDGFTEYLRQMRERIINQQYQADLLASELDRRVQMYQVNMQAAQARQNIQPPVQPIQQSVQPPVQPTQQSVQPPVQPVPQPTQPAPQPSQPMAGQGVFSSAVPYVAQEPVSPPTVSQPVPQPVYQAVVQPVYQAVVQPAYQPVPQPAKQKSNVEFTIGAAVLSIVGSVFILIALVLLGINYMNGFVKGMSLYAVCLAVMVLSELLLYKRWPKLGITFSAVSVGGLYLSTLINYLALKNFNMWVAMGLTLLITVGVVLLGRKKNTVTYRVLGMAAVYISILMIPMGGQAAEGCMPQTDFLVVTAMLFLINIMCLLVPAQKARTAINITHMALNTLFTLLACFLWEAEWDWTSFAQIWHYPVFVAVSLLVMQLIFISQVRWQVKQKPDSKLEDNVGICITYGISTLFYMLMTSGVTDFAYLIINDVSEDIYLVHRLVCTAVVLCICGISMLALRGRQERWFAWYLLNLLAFTIHFNAAATEETTYCLVALLAVTKLLSFTKNSMLRISDAVLTAFACIPVLVDHSHGYVVPLFIVLVLSVLCINYWKVYFEAVLTFVIALYTSMHMLPALKLPVFVGILFVGMLLFNNVKRWRGRGMIVYNSFALAGQAVCYLLLINPVYFNAHLTYLCMLIFGVSTIVICFQGNYQMDFRGKRMVLAIFLTYMALVIRTSFPIVNSILMMLIALICVGIGFAERRKALRIYGLVLSLVVCGKIVLYDFLEAPLLQRTVLFFIVGTLALVISAIYMILEKKQGKNQKSPEEQSIQEEQGAV